MFIGKLYNSNSLFYILKCDRVVLLNRSCSYGVVECVRSLVLRKACLFSCRLSLELCRHLEVIILTPASLVIEWNGKLRRSNVCSILLLSVSLLLLLLIVTNLRILLLHEASCAVWTHHIPIVLLHVGVTSLTSQTRLALELLETLLKAKISLP